MRRLFVLTLAVSGLLLSSCSHKKHSPVDPDPTGSVDLSIRCGQVGSLQKAHVISLLHLYIRLSAENEDDVLDTLDLSGGYGQQSVSKYYLDLAANKLWTITAESRDAEDQVIHSGSDTFTVLPAQNVPVFLDLNAQYTMLKVSFLNIVDSLTKCEIVADDESVADTAFEKQQLVGRAVVLGYDYLSADAGPGISHSLTLNAYGDVDGAEALLYSGSVDVNAVSGVDTSLSVVLEWLGLNGARADVTLGAVATVSMYARFQDFSNYNPGMVRIPSAGFFNIGQVGIGNAEPVHRVELTHDLWMDTTEVTQADYATLMSVNPSGFSSDLSRPVENVTWFDAVLYCNARSNRDGLDTVYSYTSISGTPGNGCTDLGGLAIDYTKYGYRLPTEAEWEFACRGLTTGSFYFDSLQINNYAWSSANSANVTHPVAQKLPNAFGLYDMSGNVWEWCNDWYETYEEGTQIDPTGPATGENNRKVVRGGAWNLAAAYLRSAYRINSYQAIYGYNYIGFRTVSLRPVVPQ